MSGTTIYDPSGHGSAGRMIFRNAGTSLNAVMSICHAGTVPYEAGHNYIGERGMIDRHLGGKALLL